MKITLNFQLRSASCVRIWIIVRTAAPRSRLVFGYSRSKSRATTESSFCASFSVAPAARRPRTIKPRSWRPTKKSFVAPGENMRAIARGM